MQFQKLGNIRAKHPRLRKLIDDLAAYIEAQLANGADKFVPALVARHLGVSEAQALGLLAAFEDEGLVRSAYEVVCKGTSTVLATVHSKSQLAELLPIHCEFCDSDHGADDLSVELVFEVVAAPAQRNAFA